MKIRQKRDNKLRVFSTEYKMYGIAIVQEIQRLKGLGNSQRQTARLMGINPRTVRRYWNIDPFELPLIKRGRKSYLEKYKDRICELFKLHRNADVVRQELVKQYGEDVPLRTLQQFIKPYRDSLIREQLEQSKPVQRIETLPGDFLQIDFGERTIWIANRKTKIHIFVATLAYSRRVYVQVTESEKQDDWLSGIESAFKHFGGIPRYIVCDNPKAMIKETALRHSRVCKFNNRFINFCLYWNVQPIACYPRYPQSKGKVEKMVDYVKNNGIAGHRFESVSALQKHISWWIEFVSDARVMRHLVATEEPIPKNRFKTEIRFLRAIEKPDFLKVREVQRKVDVTGCISFDTRQYQLEAKYVGLYVRVLAHKERIEVFTGEKLIGTFDKTRDVAKPTIFNKVTEYGIPRFGATDIELFQNPLQRSLSDYESIAGGSW